jgi:hypothetical protein
MASTTLGDEELFEKTMKKAGIKDNEDFDALWKGDKEVPMKMRFGDVFGDEEISDLRLKIHKKRREEN